MSEKTDALAELIRKAKVSRCAADRSLLAVKTNLGDAGRALMHLRHDLDSLAAAFEAERAA